MDIALSHPLRESNKSSIAFRYYLYMPERATTIAVEIIERAITIKRALHKRSHKKISKAIQKLRK